mmetsp:Transcript_38219/g.126567  ORF Transcript_38219/g.126567 Transcript_38219/m.126567 type:complete len:674 (+) Transcript_38219:1039-3060(+)
MAVLTSLPNAASVSATLAGKPNIVLFLQDDQDFLEGRASLRPLPKALSLIGDRGAFAENWFVHTPVCCPSRAELLTGRYFHNLRMPSGGGGGCMHVQTGVAGREDKANAHSFAKHLVREAGYTAGWFGKHLNACPHEPPPGYDCPTCRWFANGGAEDTEPGGYLGCSFSDFAGGVPSNGTYSRNGTYRSWRPGAPTAGGLRLPQHGGYVTSIIANLSLEWLQTVGGSRAPRDADGALLTPFVLTVAPKAPHYPATPAPWYEEGTWVDEERVRAPRTASFGVAPSRLADHHGMIAGQGPLLPHEVSAIDRQFRKRWKALLSVDDAIAAVAASLESLRLWRWTYFFVTSDHGYNLGQHNLPSCKLSVYDHSIRVPMLLRGPGVSPQSFAEVGSNVDLAPTFLSLAGLDPPSAPGPPMDGVSLLPWLLAAAAPADLPAATRKQLAREAVRLGTPRPHVRTHHWVEFFSLGNLTVCGGGTPNGSAAGAPPAASAPHAIRGSTCQGDRDDTQGYCHMPCPHTRTGAMPLNATCDLRVCTNATCCGASGTEFSSLEGMRCGAGHPPGSLPFNTSLDPGHRCDCTETNTYRALRFVDPGGHGDLLYAEFTRLSDYNFTAADIFVEIFNLATDPGQLHNLAPRTSAADLAFYRETAQRQFRCSGQECVDLGRAATRPTMKW